MVKCSVGCCCFYANTDMEIGQDKITDRKIRTYVGGSWRRARCVFLPNNTSTMLLLLPVLD